MQSRVASKRLHPAAALGFSKEAVSIPLIAQAFFHTSAKEFYVHDNETTFRLLCSGRWTPEQVHALYDRIPHILPAPHHHAAPHFWQQLLAANKSHLFNGELFQFKKIAATPQRLELALGHTCYRDQIYCNANTQTLLQEHGIAALTRGLGVSAIVITSDDYLPLMRRSARAGEEPGKLDVFGGHAHPDQHLRHGRPDLFGAIAEEIATELNVPAHDLSSSLCCGLVENLKTHKPDLVFQIHVRPTREEIMRTAPHALEADEVAELFFLPAPDVYGFLREHEVQFTPSAQASLALWRNLPLREPRRNDSNAKAP